MELKNVRRGRIKEYAERFRTAVYTAVDPGADHDLLWDHKADCAFPPWCVGRWRLHRYTGRPLDR